MWQYSWLVGPRDRASARAFMDDLAGRVRCRIQLTTDGLRKYIDAEDFAFGTEVDYAMLEKVYANSTEEGGQRRYSPAVCTKAIAKPKRGNPDLAHVSTSYVERQNLTMRMSMRRFTRLTNGFSKKYENHCNAVALHFMYYNFCRIHQTTRVTPAMEAGICGYVWTLEDVVRMADTNA